MTPFESIAATSGSDFMAIIGLGADEEDEEDRGPSADSATDAITGVDSIDAPIAAAVVVDVDDVDDDVDDDDVEALLYWGIEYQRRMALESDDKI